MGIFGGWLPPGCSIRDLDDAMGVNNHCEVCGSWVDNCICSECPVCEEAGNLICYSQHGMVATEAQKLSRDWAEAIGEAEARAEAAMPADFDY
jgi:hypothetical protein